MGEPKAIIRSIRPYSVDRHACTLVELGIEGTDYVIADAVDTKRIMIDEAYLDTFKARAIEAYEVIRLQAEPQPASPLTTGLEGDMPGIDAFESGDDDD